MGVYDKPNVTITNGVREVTIPKHTYNTFKGSTYDGWDLVGEPKKEISKMSKAELLKEVAEAGLTPGKTASKTDLINMLNNKDESE